MTKPKFYPFMQFEANFTENYPEDSYVKYINHQNKEHDKMMKAFGKFAIDKGVFPFAHSVLPDARRLFEEWQNSYKDYIKIEIDHYEKE